jgi:hypothetical protein
VAQPQTGAGCKPPDPRVLLAQTQSCRIGFTKALDGHNTNERAHLGDGDGIELTQAIWRGQALVNQHGIDALQIGQHDQLLQRGRVSHVADLLWVGLTPLGGSHTKQGHVEQIGLAGIHGRRLMPGQLARQEVRLDGIGVDPVVDLGQGA